MDGRESWLPGVAGPGPCDPVGDGGRPSWDGLGTKQFVKCSRQNVKWSRQNLISEGLSVTYIPGLSTILENTRCGWGRGDDAWRSGIPGHGTRIVGHGQQVETILLGQVQVQVLVLGC